MSNVKKIVSVCLALTFTFLLAAPAFAADADDPLRQAIDRYDYIIGTNAFSPNYQFTEADPLTELADAIEAWGSNMIKFNARTDDSLVDRVLEGHDFDYVFLWYRSDSVFKDGYSEAEARADYDAFYAFTQKLLRAYNGTGKQFFLGHWEGDWYYLSGYDTSKTTVDDVVTDGMIAWLNNRQKAVDDAKRDTPHDDVYVWNYLELNRPVDALKKGYDRVVNRVLPNTTVDYVSYSAYDSMRSSPRSVRRVIDYIYENLPEKSGVPAPRVFIGEAAEAAFACGYDDTLHCETNLCILKKYLRCDVGFILYWQMYCNEETDDGGSRGFWLIDENGNQTRLYRKLAALFADGKAYVERFAEKNGRVPTVQEYRAFLLRHPVFAFAGLLLVLAKVLHPVRQCIDRLRD